MPPKPVPKRWLPREGLTIDVLARLLANTALNPLLTLPLLLLARLTKRGSDLSVLHPVARSRLRLLLWLGLARWLSAYWSRGAQDNWARDDTWDWEGREIVVVTGGAGGIGGHVVRMLAERGVKVAVLDILPLGYQAPPNVHYYKCDLTSPRSIAAAAQRLRGDLGGDPTVLINNAGVARGRTLLGASERDIRFTLDVNCLAHAWTAREFVPAMARADHGMVVTVASWAAWLSVAGMGDYAASKAGARSVHEALAAELVGRYGARRVRTVLVAQGHTRTALFAGWREDRAGGFLVPSLEPETVAEGIVRQVLSGRSGQVIVPGFGNVLAGMGGWPMWMQVGLRNACEGLMTNFRGRQVVEDLDRLYEEREREEREERAEEKEDPDGGGEEAVAGGGGGGDGGESAVLVAPE